MNFERYKSYAGKWHILNFKGYSFGDIALEHGVEEELVEKVVSLFRDVNNFEAPVEVEKAQGPQREILPLEPEERIILATLLRLDREKEPVTAGGAASVLKLPMAQVSAIMRGLVDKQYIHWRRQTGAAIGGIYAVPLLNLRGESYTAGEADYIKGKDGVKRYRPLYSEGYGMPPRRRTHKLATEEA